MASRRARQEPAETRDADRLAGRISVSEMFLQAAARVVALAAAAHSCQAPLPRGPVLPAPLVVWGSCGAFRVAADGSVRRLPRHWLALHNQGTGRRFEPLLDLRRNPPGRFFLTRGGRLVWRSHALYPRDGGSVAFGPGEFAFGTYRSGVFLTDLHHPERLVVAGREVAPIDFTRGGDLLVAGARRIVVVSRSGRTLRRLAYRAQNGYSFDERSDALYFVTSARRLAVLRGHNVRLLRRVPVDGIVSTAARGLLVFSGGRSLAVTRRDGTLVARTSWRSSPLHSDSGVSVAPDGRALAYRLSDARPGAASGSATLYLLRFGARAPIVLFRQRLGANGCWVGANLVWHGGSLLYSSSDRVDAVIDTRTGLVTRLGRLTAAIPHRYDDELLSVAWASDMTSPA